MSADVLAMHCAALPAARAVGFKGTEALCRPFEFDVLFTVPAGTDVRAAINAPATLTLERGGDSPPMCWHGVFVRLDALASKARLAGARFTGANLFRADLSRVVGDGRTSFDGANVTHVRFLPKADVPPRGDA